MNRDELLVWIKPKISNYYYEVLEMWTKNKEKKLFSKSKRKFYIEPTFSGRGYEVNVERSDDFIIVYPERII